MTQNSRLLLPILLTALICACSAQGESEIPVDIRSLENLTTIPANAEPEWSVQLVEEQRFGEIYLTISPPSVGFGPVTAVDGDGNVYLADKGEKVIHVFNPGGTNLTEIGREGEGPGEFMEITGIRIHNNMLQVYDARTIRLQLFSLNPPELFHTIIFDPQQWNRYEEVRGSRPFPIMALSDTAFLAGISLTERKDRSYHGYYQLNLDGEVVSEKLLEEQRLLRQSGTLSNGMTTSIPLPFSSKGVVQVGPDGTIYHANTGEFLIRSYSPNGTYRQAIYHPFERDPLEEQEALDQFHPNAHSIISSADFPNTWPVFESMLIDDENRIWLSTIIDDKEVYEWWIVSNDGVLLARFKWPRDRKIEFIRNNHVYTLATNQQTGIIEVVRYSMEIQEN